MFSEKMENEKFPNVTHNPPIVQSTSKISWEVFPLYSFSWRHMLWFPKYVAMFMLIWLQDSVTLYYAETDKPPIARLMEEGFINTQRFRTLMMVRNVKIILHRALCSISHPTACVIPQYRELSYITKQTSALHSAWRCGHVPLPHPTLPEKVVMERLNQKYQEYFNQYRNNIPRAVQRMLNEVEFSNKRYPIPMCINYLPLAIAVLLVVGTPSFLYSVSYCFAYLMKL